MDDPADDRLREAMHPPHRRGELLFAVASFAVAVFLATQWWSETTLVDRIDWRRQPGLWPAIAIAGMLVSGAGELVASVLRARRQGMAGVGAEVLSWGRAVEFIVWFMAYVWLVPLMGYLPSTVAFAVMLTWRLGYRGGWLLAAAATGVGVVVVFKGLLAVRIPGGAVYEAFPPTIRNVLVLYL